MRGLTALRRFGFGRVMMIPVVLGLLAAAPAGALELRSTALDQTPAGTAACAVLSAPVQTQGVDLAAFVKVEPAAPVQVRADRTALCVNGLPPGGSYRITLLPGLPGTDGSSLAAEQGFDMEIPNRAPLVRFAGTGIVLPRVGATGVALETVNVERLKVKVYRAGERLVSRLMLEPNPYSYSARSIANSDARLVWEGSLEPVAATPNAVATTSFPLADVLTDRAPGAYLLIAEDARLAQAEEDGRLGWQERQEMQAARWVIETDLALSALGAADGLAVTVRSLATAKPLADTRLVLVARDNGVLGELKTGGDGIVRFPAGLIRGTGGARPKAVMAYGPEGDFTLLDLDKTYFDFSDRGAAGRPDPGPLDAFLATERGIYRPGETVHATLLLRDRLTAAVDGTPVILSVFRPDGVLFREVPVETRAGGATLSIPLTASARRGGWSIAARLQGGDAELGRVGFDVQDFVPQQLKVSLDTGATVVAAGGVAELGVEAGFLYGAPAAMLPVATELRLEPDREPFDRLPGFLFGREDETLSVLDGEGQVVPAGLIRIVGPATDADGRAALFLEIPAVAPGTTLPVVADIRVEVTEPGGRATWDSVRLPVRTAERFVGLKPGFAGGLVAEGQPARFTAALVDADGNPVAAGDLEWTLTEIDTRFTWFSQEGRWLWRESVQEIPAGGGRVTVDDKGLAELSVETGWGRWRLDIVDPATGAASSLGFHSGWYAAEADTERTPDTVTVTVDRTAYRAGETARVRVEPPFAGEMQLAIVSDRIHLLQNRTVGSDSVTLEVPVAADWGAGAYALVSFVRPVEAQAGHRPVRAVGLAWLGLDPAARGLEVTLAVPDRIVPRQTLEVPVTVRRSDDGKAPAGAAYVILAAVDVGILQLTDYSNPDPLAHFLAQRRLAVELRDDYGRLLDGRAGPAGAVRSGGDGFGGVGLPRVPTRTVALFSGMVPLDRDGRATIPLDIPDFNGALRLMAIAWDADRVGGGAADLAVRDPVVAELLLPRFLAPGDRADAAVSVHNVDGPAGTYTLTVTTDGPLGVDGPAERAVELDPGERLTLPLPIAGTGAGTARIDLALAGPGGISIARDSSIVVRPSFAPTTLVDLAQQGPGETFTVDPVLFQPFLEGTAALTLGYSSLPGIDVPGLLRDLDRYPYGCTEQVLSVAMPLLAFPDLARDIESQEQDRPRDIALRIADAIAKVADRQGFGGRFGLWSPGDDFATPWLHAYAMDFLTRAMADGHYVSESVLADGRRGLERLVADALRLSSYTEVTENRAAIEAGAYAALVLTRMGNPAVADLRLLAERVQRLPPSALVQAWLGAAFAAVGDPARAEMAFGRARAALDRRAGDPYASLFRDTAATLTLAAEAGNRETVAFAADRLRGLFAAPDSLHRANTVEKAWSLLAARALLRDGGEVSLDVDGVRQVASGSPLAFTPDAAAAAQGFAVANTGAGPVWRTLSLTGIARDPLPPQQERGIRISQQVFALDGTPVDPARVARNAKLVVVVSGRVERPGRRTLVVVAPLPAGWEIEGTVDPQQPAGLGWLGEITRTPVREARDDRFVAIVEHGYVYPLEWVPEEEADKPPAFTGPKLQPGEFRFAYVARAVTAGDFVLPQAVAEDMYDAATVGRTEAGRTRVVLEP